MILNPDQIYHVYNRGNNRQLIFLDDENYNYFLKKVKKFIVPYCDILAFILMPNHFHFLLTPNEKSNITYKPSNRWEKRKDKAPVKLTMFSRGLQQTLSTYARGINKRYDRCGSLFQQNTRIQITSSESYNLDYALWCFKYIHDNAVKAGLVEDPMLYQYSSFRDYMGISKDSICNMERARVLLNLDAMDLFPFNDSDIPDAIMKAFY